MHTEEVGEDSPDVGSLIECRAWLLGGLWHQAGCMARQRPWVRVEGRGGVGYGHARDLLGYGVVVARWAEGATWAGWAGPGAGRLRGEGVAMLSSLLFSLSFLYI